MTIRTTKDLPTPEVAVASFDLVVKDQKWKRGTIVRNASERSKNACNKRKLNERCFSNRLMMSLKESS